MDLMQGAGQRESKSDLVDQRGMKGRKDQGDMVGQMHEKALCEAVVKSGWLPMGPMDLSNRRGSRRRTQIPVQGPKPQIHAALIGWLTSHVSGLLRVMASFHVKAETCSARVRRIAMVAKKLANVRVAAHAVCRTTRMVRTKRV